MASVGTASKSTGLSSQNVSTNTPTGGYQRVHLESDKYTLKVARASKNYQLGSETTFQITTNLLSAAKVLYRCSAVQNMGYTAPKNQTEDIVDGTADGFLELSLNRGELDESAYTGKGFYRKNSANNRGEFYAKIPADWIGTSNCEYILKENNQTLAQTFDSFTFVDNSAAGLIQRSVAGEAAAATEAARLALLQQKPCQFNLFKLASTYGTVKLWTTFAGYPCQGSGCRPDKDGNMELPANFNASVGLFDESKKSDPNVLIGKPELTISCQNGGPVIARTYGGMPINE